MKISKIFKGIIGIGAVSGIAYTAYKLGEMTGEVNERFNQKYGEDEEDEIRFYDDMDEPDDGCLAPAHEETSDNDADGTEAKFGPLEIININGVTIGQLRGLLLYLTVLKNFCKKNVREYLGVDDEETIEDVITFFEVSGYICKRDKYKYHTLTNIADCAKIIGW